MTGSPYPPFYYHTPQIAKKHGFARYWKGKGLSIYVHNKKKTIILFSGTEPATLVQISRDGEILDEFFLDELTAKMPIHEALEKVFEYASLL